MSKIQLLFYMLSIFVFSLWLSLTFENGILFCAGALFGLSLRALLSAIHNYRSTKQFLYRIREDKYDHIFSKKEDLS